VGVWTKVTGTVDFSAASALCQTSPTTTGVVRSAVLYLNQTAAGTPTAQPDLYLDDVVITVTDGHNLVGNPNFEAAVTSGWTTSGGGALAPTTLTAVSGTQALAMTGRTNTFSGPKWNLPLGPAKYKFTFNALHDGAMNHDLILQPTYKCLGGSDQFPFPGIATASQAGGNSWNTLTGTYTFPPATAPAGCKLVSAGVYVQQEFVNGGACTGECPNIYIDDVSITLAP